MNPKDIPKKTKKILLSRTDVRNAKPSRSSLKASNPGTKARPGQRKPFRRSTTLEVEERTQWLVCLIVRRPIDMPSVFVNAMSKHFRIAKNSVSDTYLPAAYRRIRQLATMPLDDARVVVVSTLLDMMQRETGAVRLSATMSLARIYGMDKVRIDLTTDGGEARPMERLTTEQLTRLIDHHQRLLPPVTDINGKEDNDSTQTRAAA